MTLLVVFLVPKVIVIVEELHIVSVLVDVIQVGLGAINPYDERYVGSVNLTKTRDLLQQLCGIWYWYFQ